MENFDGSNNRPNAGHDYSSIGISGEAKAHLGDRVVHNHYYSSGAQITKLTTKLPRAHGL